MGMKTGSGGFQVKELFKKTAIGLSLSAAMMSVALPGDAGQLNRRDELVALKRLITRGA